MPRCNDGPNCGCRIEAGAGVTVTGSGSARDPWIVTAEGSDGAAGGFDPGDIKDTVRTGTPAGWLECDGRTVSRDSYPELFAAIGTRWGAGDGFSTFNVPNFSGRFRVTTGPGYALAASGGSAETALTVENMPAHTHTIGSHVHDMGNHTHSDAHDHGVTSTESALHTHAYQYPSPDQVQQGEKGNKNVLVPGNPTTKSTGGQPERHTHVVNAWQGRTDGPTPGNTGAAGATTTSSVGSGASVTNLPPYRAVRTIIKT